METDQLETQNKHYIIYKFFLGLLIFPRFQTCKWSLKISDLKYLIYNLLAIVISRNIVLDLLISWTIGKII